jgi:hypothetical protein
MASKVLGIDKKQSHQFDDSVFYCLKIPGRAGEKDLKGRDKKKVLRKSGGKVKFEIRVREQEVLGKRISKIKEREMNFWIK